ncbi:hypothetical protein ACH0BF_13030 [Pseudobacillus sp. 179-B 2D1 NHS]|uniref:hypothetical protein n=1 Tax=Pseudobacillus sp. 179-B 2D1 NHS TaxID=3374292 RepID=UPI003879A26F
MDLLLWITLGFILIGFIVIVFIKRNMVNKKNPTTPFIVWWIVGTTVWGVVSIFLITGLFNKFH